MRSKQIALIAMALALGACGRFIGEEEFVGGLPAGLGAADVGCLNGASETFAEYFQGEGSEQRVSALFDCADKSLQIFGDRTRGADRERYTPEELTKFLHKYFVKDRSIKPGLIAQAMEVKAALVGGDARFITREELKRGRDLIRELKLHTVKLLPLQPLSAKRFSKLSKHEVDEAARILEESARQFGQGILRGKAPYSFEHLDGLLSELDGIVPHEKIAMSRRYLPVLGALKAFLVKPDAKAIHADEWQDFMGVAARSYGFFLKFSHFRVNHAADWNRGESRERLVVLLNEALTLLEDSVRRHPGEVISIKEIQFLIDSVDPKELIEKSGLPLESLDNLKKTIAPVVRNFLGAERLGPGGRDADGLTPDAIDYLRRVLARWSDNQAQIERIVREEKVPKSDLTRFFDVTPPMFTNRTKFIKIPADEGQKPDFHNLSMLNWMRELARMLIRGYAADDRARLETGITLPEFRRAYEDVRDIGIELKFLDRNDPLVPEKRFAEANYFSFVANGDEFLDLAEATQMFGFAISAKVAGDTIHDWMMKDRQRVSSSKDDICHYKGKPQYDEFGFALVTAECFQDRFYQHFDKHLTNLPLFVHSLWSQSSRKQAEFRKVFEASGRRSKDVAWINSADMQALSMLASYVEALFYRFDKDRSGSFTHDEAALAFPIFQKTLEGVLCTNDEKRLRMAFDFLMEKGDKPEGWKELTPLLLRRLRDWIFRRDPSYHADRLTVLKIFAEFSKAEGPAKAECKKAE